MRLAHLPLLLALAGCASPMAGARTSYAAARAVYDAAEARYRAEQDVCLNTLPEPESCVASVRARWSEARRAADALRLALVAAAGSLAVQDALSAAGGTPDPSALQKAAREALDAAEALSRALASMGAP